MGSFITGKTAYYYYKQLDNKESELYSYFLGAILELKQSVKIYGNFTVDQIKKVSNYILNDRPDIFWYRGKMLMSLRDNIPVEIEFSYVYQKPEVDRIIAKIENSVFYREVTKRLESEKTDFGKALLLYEYIILNTEYEKGIYKDPEAYDYAYGIEGVILKHRAVCAGYAKTFQYFANKFGIFATFVGSQTTRGSHAWNLVNLYGNYYYVDATWGDPTFSDDAEKPADNISYDFFCITTKELEKTHKPKFETKMPLCVATDCNYYHFFGLVEENYSLNRVAAHIIMAKSLERKNATIKFTNLKAYETAVKELFDKEKVFEALKIAGRVLEYKTPQRVEYTVDNLMMRITIHLM